MDSVSNIYDHPQGSHVEPEMSSQLLSSLIHFLPDFFWILFLGHSIWLNLKPFRKVNPPQDDKESTKNNTSFFGHTFFIFLVGILLIGGLLIMQLSPIGTFVVFLLGVLFSLFLWLLFLLSQQNRWLYQIAIIILYIFLLYIRPLFLLFYNLDIALPLLALIGGHVLVLIIFALGEKFKSKPKNILPHSKDVLSESTPALQQKHKKRFFSSQDNPLIFLLLFLLFLLFFDSFILTTLAHILNNFFHFDAVYLLIQNHPYITNLHGYLALIHVFLISFYLFLFFKENLPAFQESFFHTLTYGLLSIFSGFLFILLLYSFLSFESKCSLDYLGMCSITLFIVNAIKIFICIFLMLQSYIVFHKNNTPLDYEKTYSQSLLLRKWTFIALSIWMVILFLGIYNLIQ